VLQSFLETFKKEVSFSRIYSNNNKCFYQVTVLTLNSIFIYAASFVKEISNGASRR
jgi:hypothetical protein